jgi:hypothetical protein
MPKGTAKPDKNPRPTHPNSVFTKEIADRICSRIGNGESLRTICSDADLPHISTFMRWLADESRSELREQYVCARELQADKYAEEIIQIADDGGNDTYLDEDGQPRTEHDVIARSRLRVDARKWYASKLAPKKYGDKVEQTVQGPDGGPVPISLIERRIVHK